MKFVITPWCFVSMCYFSLSALKMGLFFTPSLLKCLLFSGWTEDGLSHRNPFSSQTGQWKKGRGRRCWHPGPAKGKPPRSAGGGKAFSYTSLLDVPFPFNWLSPIGDVLISDRWMQPADLIWPLSRILASEHKSLQLCLLDTIFTELPNQIMNK